MWEEPLGPGQDPPDPDMMGAGGEGTPSAGEVTGTCSRQSWILVTASFVIISGRQLSSTGCSALIGPWVSPQVLRDPHWAPTWTSSAGTRAQDSLRAYCLQLPEIHPEHLDTDLSRAGQPRCGGGGAGL